MSRWSAISRVSKQKQQARKLELKYVPVLQEKKSYSGDERKMTIRKDKGTLSGDVCLPPEGRGRGGMSLGEHAL